MKLFYPVLALLAIFSACKNDKKPPVTTVAVTFSKEGELQLFSAETDSLLAVLDIEIAEDDYKIQTGLMYRQSMEDHQGMLFVFPDERPRSFYMKNTEIPLDIIFIDRERKVVNVGENAQPFDETSVRSAVPAQYVLEVNAGSATKWGLLAGDSISFSTSR